jgi:hypothetical protein
MGQLWEDPTTAQIAIRGGLEDWCWRARKNQGRARNLLRELSIQSMGVHFRIHLYYSAIQPPFHIKYVLDLINL